MRFGRSGAWGVGGLPGFWVWGVRGCGGVCGRWLGEQSCIAACS